MVWTKICAIKELKILGVRISEELEKHITESHRLMIENNRINKEKRNSETEKRSLAESDEHFAFIAGYTSGGFPYGIPHEEFESKYCQKKTRPGIFTDSYLLRFIITKISKWVL